MSDMVDRWPGQIAASFAKQAEEIIESRIGPTDFLYRACESPIEKAFAVSFDLMHGMWRGGANGSATLWRSSEAPQIFMVPQYQIEQFRVDFLIGWNIGEHRFTSIAVECDGHDFHEKTKAQAASDKARDRVLAQNVARTLRYTGSEIYKDPCACAAEVLGLADELFWSWHFRGERQ